MSVALLNFAIPFETETCFKCHAQFAVAQTTRQAWVSSGKSFWCCHCGQSQCYMESETSKLKKQLAEAERLREWHKQRSADERAARERTERRLVAQRSATKRISNRIKHGVCPCCTRTFSNLASHMETKHPEFKA